MIFERSGEHLTLAGVMYTANKNATGEQLDADVPLGIARWHRHVRFCWPPAGGRWMPELFGWMVHVWPLERDPAKVWAVHRDASTEGMGAMPGMTH